MTLKSFLIGMFASFGLAWFCMIAIPAAKMASLPPVKMSDEEDAEYYQRKTSGRLVNGAEIYAANGCYTCHSRLTSAVRFSARISQEFPMLTRIPAVRLTTMTSTAKNMPTSG